MGKISLDFHFLNEDGDVISTVTFNSLDDIDLCIEMMQEARAEFEHRIEMKKMKAREKRNRRKEKKNLGNVPKDIVESIKELGMSYSNLDDSIKPLCKPVLDMVKSLVKEVSAK